MQKARRQRRPIKTRPSKPLGENPITTPLGERLLNVREVAYLLNINTKKVYGLVLTKELPIVRVGRSMRFNRRSIDQIMIPAPAAPTPKKPEGN